MKIHYSERAQADIRGIGTNKLRRKIVRAINRLGHNPRPLAARKRRDYWKRPVEDYDILYTIGRSDVYIEKIRPRRRRRLR